MTTTWVVVAHRAGARILEQNGPKAGLELVHESDHPEGRLKSSEIDTDGPGQTTQTGNPGMRDLEKHEGAHEHVARTFAKQLAEVVDRGRMDGRFGQVVLVAEPHFLGLLRASLSKEVTKMVEASVSKDLAHVAIRDLGPHLEGVLRL